MGVIRICLAKGGVPGADPLGAPFKAVKGIKERKQCVRSRAPFPIDADFKDRDRRSQV